MSQSLKTITVMEANQLLDVLLRNSGTLKQKLKGLRNYLIGLLMYDAGLRIGEVCKLRVSDLTANGLACGSLLVNSDIAKGRRERTIPMSQRIRRAIEGLNSNVWFLFKYETDTPAFCSLAHKYGLTPRQVQRIIGDASEKAFGRRIHPHILRHSFATRLMRTTNIRIVQEALGHKNLTSTQIYTHPDLEDLKNAIGHMDDAAEK